MKDLIESDKNPKDIITKLTEEVDLSNVPKEVKGMDMKEFSDEQISLVVNEIVPFLKKEFGLTPVGISPKWGEKTYMLTWEMNMGVRLSFQSDFSDSGERAMKKGVMRVAKKLDRKFSSKAKVLKNLDFDRETSSTRISIRLQ